MAFVKDMEISNSTFYSHLQSGNRFIRHSGANAQNVPGWSTGSMKFLNNTFYNISYSGQSFNGNGWKKTSTQSCQRTIFFVILLTDNSISVSEYRVLQWQ